MDGDRRGLAFVVGAGAGVGVGIARQLAERGCDVVVVADAGLLASRDGVAALHRRIEEQERPLDALIVDLAVGRAAPRATPPAAPAGCDWLIDLPVRGAVALTRLCLPGLVTRARGGVLLISPPTPPSDPSGRHLAAFVAAAGAELQGTGVTVAHCVHGGPDPR